MTTPDTFTKTAEVQGGFRLPDPPQREPDEMTQYDQLFKYGYSHALAVHLGNPETTLVEADRWIVARPEYNKARARRPDLLVAFGVDPEVYRRSNGYIVSEQGKPPDFVLEVASESTGAMDVGANGWTMPVWAYPSTGASTRRESITGRGWPVTGWWRADTNPYR